MKNDYLSKFTQIISKCGIEPDGITFIQRLPTNIVIDNFKELFSKGNLSSFDKFKDILKCIHNDSDVFFSFLQPVKSNYDLYLFTTPKSLCQLFLMISELSPFLIEILIEKVCNLAQNNVDTDNKLAILCLDQFKWNIYNKNMDDIMEKLLDLGYVTNILVQNHLITIFPDICQGKYNKLLAQKLLDWISTSNNLISSCLETISKLDLPDYYLKDVELLVTGMLDSATMNTLPPIITFLIKCTDKTNQINLIDKIRLNIEFDNLQSMFCSAFSSTPIDYIKSDFNSAVKLINSININLQFNPNLRKSWLKSIINNIDAVRSQNFDFVILLIIFHEYKMENSVIVNLIKTKIVKKQFTAEMIEILFKYHLGLVKPLYKSFLKIMNLMLSYNGKTFIQFVKMGYLHCFLNPIPNWNEQQIFDGLIVDLVIKTKNVVDGILEILKYLATNCKTIIQPFYTQISDLLTGRLELSCNQIYDLYCIFGIIGFHESSYNENLVDERHKIRNDIILLIKKQLENPDFIIRRNGGIGAVTVMKYLANQNYNNADSVSMLTHMIANHRELDSDCFSNNSDYTDITTRQRIVATILKLLLSYNDIAPELIIVVFDELYRLISLDEMLSVEKEIDKIIELSFKDLFISDNTPNDNFLFGLVERERCLISITISYTKCNYNISRTITNINIAAHLRLLVACKLRSEKNLTKIEALLSCPILLSGQFETSSPIELLTLINWLIEVVNAFSSDIISIDNFRLSVMQRMKLIVNHVMNLEMKLCAQSKPMKLPTINANNGSNLVTVTEVKKTIVKRKSIKKPSKKTKKSKSNIETVNDIFQESIANSEDELFEEDDLLMEKIDEFDNNNSNNVRSKLLSEELSLCYREIDLSVYSMLTDLAVSEFVLCNTNDDGLGWRELQYFLSDLSLKLKHCLRDKTGFLGGYSSSVNQKNFILFRHIDQINEDIIIEKAVEMGMLFKLVLTKCIEICISNEVFDSLEDSCFKVMELLLRIIAKIFHFLKGYSVDKREEMTERLFDYLSSDDSVSFVHTLLSVKDKIPSISIAAAYCELLSELSTIKFPDCKDIAMIDITNKYLQTNWNKSNIGSYKSAVSKLFEIHLLALTNQWYDVIYSQIIPEMQSLVAKDNDNTSVQSSIITTYTCLDKLTILGVFKQISEFILKKCKYLSKVDSVHRNTTDMLMSWDKIISILILFSKIVAADKESHMILCFIKFSREFIKFVIKDLMPILDNMFRHENELVIQLIMGIQSVTRFVQRLCTHCKSKNNLASASLVPQVRRYLETFMFRVKKMMHINKCSGDSIDILLLANKDLHGQRIEESIVAAESDEENTVVSEDVDTFSQDLENEALSDD